MYDRLKVVRIKLSEFERDVAEGLGIRRDWDAKHKDGKENAQGLSDKKGLVEHIIGATGEQVYCSGSNVYNPLRSRVYKDKPDVGNNIEVRATRKPDRKLIVHPYEPDDFICVLVRPVDQEWTWETRHQVLTWEISGWIQAKDAKHEEWLWAAQGRQLQYYVPASCLEPMETLWTSEFLYKAFLDHRSECEVLLTKKAEDQCPKT